MKMFFVLFLFCISTLSLNTFAGISSAGTSSGGGSDTFENVVLNKPQLIQEESKLRQAGFERSEVPAHIVWTNEKFSFAKWYIQHDSWTSVEVLVLGHMAIDVEIDSVSIKEHNP